MILYFKPLKKRIKKKTKMNENFFGKYSVFCVFGSVVGCVVVPLIAQVVQQQVSISLSNYLIC